MSRCSFVLTAAPPDPTGGWTVRFFRNGTTAVGSSDSAAPYTRTVELTAPGPYVFTATWTKAGQTVRSPAAVTRVCP